jgi:hypothetical protein
VVAVVAVSFIALPVRAGYRTVPKFYVAPGGALARGQVALTAVAQALDLGGDRSRERFAQTRVERLPQLGRQCDQRPVDRGLQALAQNARDLIGQRRLQLAQHRVTQ